MVEHRRMPQDSPAPPREDAAPSAPPPSLGRKVATAAAWMVGVNISSRLLGVVSMLIVARILVPADYGLVAMATAFSQSVDAFSEVGLRDALVRHAEEGRGLYDTAFTLQALRGVITAIIVGAAAPFASLWFHEPRLTPILLILAALAAMGGLENIGIAAFRRNFRFGMEFVLLVVPRLLQVATAIVAALLLRTYWALIIAIAVSKLSRFIATYVVHPYRPRWKIARWRDLAGFSFWTWAASLAGVAWSRSDAFIIAPAMGAAALGIYSLAWEVGALPISELIGPVTAALFPGFAAARRGGDPDALSPMGVVALLLLIMLPLGVAISAAAGPVVLVLLGPKWIAARPLVAIAAITCAVAPFGWVSYTLLSASGKVARLFLVIALSALARVGMLIYAVRSGDLMTVMWWSLGSLIFEGMVFAVVLRLSGELHLGHSRGPIARSLLAGVATLVAVWATGWGWRDSAAPRDFYAFLDGLGIAVFAIAVFAVAVGLLWRLAGAPEGPETRFVAIVKSGFARVRRAAPGPRHQAS